jgi:hypothetical protein
MKIQKSKKMNTIISLILTITIVASTLAAFPIASAQTVNRYYTWLYVGTSAGGGGAGPIGVGQDMLLVAWTKDMPPDIGETSDVVASPTGRAGWYGMQISVTKPDNTTEIVNMPYSDPVGANYVSYTPEMVGTYTVQAIFPETWKNSSVSNVRSFYTAAVSPLETFTVQQEPVAKWSESPLPEDYWTRPISGAARTWYVLAGNKLGGAANVWPMGSSGGNVGSYGYGLAPESAHILWTKPFSIGGLMDERFKDINYQTSHYQGTTWSAPIILDGKIHWSPRYTTHGNLGWQAIDLYTGETIFTNYTTQIPSMASIYLYESPNQHGGFAYLWRTSGVTLPETVVVPNVQQFDNMTLVRLGNQLTINRTATTMSTGTVWEMLDGWTQNSICYIANVSTSGTQVYGKDGSILYYNLATKGTTANPNYYLTVWNSSAGTMVASLDGTGYWQWRPAAGHFGASNAFLSSSSAIYNAVHNGATFYSTNTSIPNILGPRNSRQNETGTIRAIRQDEFMIIGTAGWNDANGVAPGWMMGVSLKPNEVGRKLWEMTYTPPFADIGKNVSQPGAFTGGLALNGVYPEDGVLTWSDPQQLKRWVYDLYTGQLLWESEPEPQFTYYGISQIVYNHLLIGYGSYSGQLIAYDIKTGDIVWKYTALNVGFESPYGNYPMIIGAVADGKIYTYTSEHSYTHPQYRGPNLRCINATDGKEIWSILDFGGGLSIADGRLLGSNSLDNEIYCYGKGPSATTVTTQNDVSVLGTKVMIKGTVTDQTPTGRRNTNDGVDFTLKDTPAISDADMSAWMEYKFMQQAKPTNAKGVEVSLSAIDPNGNLVSIGTTTSDIYGNYALPYTPEVPGNYQILANFAGSKSYGPSSASAYLTVEDAPSATAAPTPAPASIADQYFIPAIAGVIVAIAIVGVILALLLLRKRP